MAFLCRTTFDSSVPYSFFSGFRDFQARLVRSDYIGGRWIPLFTCPSTNKEVRMITLSRIICMLVCGFVLSIGLSDQTIWAKDGMTDSDFTSRLGGQAGQPYGQVTHNDGSAQSKERLDSRPGERLGGQAGRAYDHVKHEYEPIPVQGRIGGEAGESYSPIQLQ